MTLRRILLAAGAMLAVTALPITASAESINHSQGWKGSSEHYNYPGNRSGYHPGYRGGYWPGYGPGPYAHRPYYSRGNWNNNNNGAAVAAGIAGLAVGAIVGSAASTPGPTYYTSSPQPWSPAWYRYCEGRYRSFDARSGTYLGYDGHRHMCR